MQTAFAIVAIVLLAVACLQDGGTQSGDQTRYSALFGAVVCAIVVCVLAFAPH